jgi:hypothetical protein
VPAAAIGLTLLYYDLRRRAVATAEQPEPVTV